MSKGENVGLVKVRLFRPFSVDDFLNALPETVRTIAVLDRTKEPGSTGEPLYNDVISSIFQGLKKGKYRSNSIPDVIRGRYGLSSKEFTPSMAIAIFEELSKPDPKPVFTIGIDDDITRLSIPYKQNFSIEPSNQLRAVFYGAGSDGTVGANKNTIKIIGENTSLYVQGNFIYDSMKSGSITVSHLRFGPEPIRSSYRINKSNFIAVHQFGFFERVNVLETVQNGAILLINCQFKPEQVWDHFPKSIQAKIIENNLRVYVINAKAIAEELGLGGRINTIMQTCFFMLTSLMPFDCAIDRIKDSIRYTYGRRGESIVNINLQAVERAKNNLSELTIPRELTSTIDVRSPVSSNAPEFVKTRTALMIAGRGDDLPVSAFDPDGTFPSGTIQYMKRSITLKMPVWDPEVCIQCGKCSLMCPHSVIRAKLFDIKGVQNIPEDFKTIPARSPSHKGLTFTIAVSPEDCTGCSVYPEEIISIQIMLSY
jgi:pyruvate-ferredoxin/flavodoxin oxidoreductase